MDGEPKLSDELAGLLTRIGDLDLWAEADVHQRIARIALGVKLRENVRAIIEALRRDGK